MFLGRWEFLGDQRSTPLRPLWYAIVSGLWFAAVWIVWGYVVGSDVALLSGAVAFVVYASLIIAQASKRMPQWPDDLSFATRRTAAWAVRRGEAVDDPATAVGVVAAAVSVQRQQTSSPPAGAIFAVIAIIATGGIAVVIAIGNALQIAGAIVLLAIVVWSSARFPGALRRQRDNAATALARARRLLGEPAA
jgi:amino acid transporter